ncbi:MAG: hypothetical protein ISR58_21730 [Anaerolineales bacterium]|nr:hypothetical protein [Anaerolineales bacterium]
MSPKREKVDGDIYAVDIPTMTNLSDAEYRYFLKKDGLFFFDPNNILMSSIAKYPISTNLEQLDILIEELELKRKTIKPKHK